VLRQGSRWPWYLDLRASETEVPCAQPQQGAGEGARGHCARALNGRLPCPSVGGVEVSLLEEAGRLEVLGGYLARLARLNGVALFGLRNLLDLAVRIVGVRRGGPRSSAGVGGARMGSRPSCLGARGAECGAGGDAEGVGGHLLGVKC
jgi:hypothetical protein